MAEMNKIEKLMINLLCKLKIIKEHIRCSLGMHDWIYIFDENGQPTKRYCENCRRQERYSEVTEEYLRIKDISYMEM